METIGKRIAYVRKEIAKLSQTEFGKLFNVGHVTVSQIELGKQNPTPQQLKVIKTKYNVSSDWILFGEGDKFGNPDTAALIAELETLKRKNQKMSALLQEYMEEPVMPGQLGKVKGNRMPVGTSKPRAAIMNVERGNGGDVTKTVTNTLKAERRA